MNDAALLTIIFTIGGLFLLLIVAHCVAWIFQKPHPGEFWVTKFAGDEWVIRYAKWPVRTVDEGWIWRRRYLELRGYRSWGDIYNSYSGVIPIVRVVDKESITIILTRSVKNPRRT